MRISAAILSRPDDPMLEWCIENTRQWADEVVVGSCGPSQCSADIKLEFPFDMLDAYGFSYLRNRIKAVATGDWIVSVDTDERFECDRETLLGECNSAEKNGNLALQTESFTGFDHLSGYAGNMEFDSARWRIFRNDPRILWRGIVHEELHFDEEHLVKLCRHSGIRCTHFNKSRPKLPVRHENNRLYAELACRAYDLHELRSKTNIWWFQQIESESVAWRTMQHAYWLGRKVLNLHPCSANPYATHVPILFDLITKSGAMLGRKVKAIELGSGLNSTPMLSMATDLRSYESDATWAHLMQRFGTKFISHYSQANAEDCDVAFIDGAFIGENTHTRAEQVERLADVVPFIVCHDTETSIYGYQHCLPQFKYKYTDMRLVPWTTVVSNSVDLSFLGGGICEYVPAQETL